MHATVAPASASLSELRLPWPARPGIYPAPDTTALLPVSPRSITAALLSRRYGEILALLTIMALVSDGNKLFVYVYIGFPDGQSGGLAQGVNSPNWMTVDRDEEYLYVVRTTRADIVRFPIQADGLGEPEDYGPSMGQRRSDEFGEDALGIFAADPAAARRRGMADGCSFDAQGNLWVTLVGAHRIVAVTPERELVTIIEDPDRSLINSPTSVALGWVRHAGCLYRFACDAVRPEGPEPGGRSAYDPPAPAIKQK
jgi:hypothetical protein